MHIIEIRLHVRSAEWQLYRDILRIPRDVASKLAKIQGRWIETQRCEGKKVPCSVLFLVI